MVTPHPGWQHRRAPTSLGGPTSRQRHVLHSRDMSETSSHPGWSQPARCWQRPAPPCPATGQGSLPEQARGPQDCHEPPEDAASSPACQQGIAPAPATDPVTPGPSPVAIHAGLAHRGLPPPASEPESTVTLTGAVGAGGARAPLAAVTADDSWCRCREASRLPSAAGPVAYHAKAGATPQPSQGPEHSSHPHGT